jgi:putative hydrolase of the HAD superfamily
MLTAAVFDLDDTLIVEEASARSSLTEVAGLVPGVEPEAFVGHLLATARRLWYSGPSHHICRELGFASWEGLWSTFEGNDPLIDELRAWIPTYQHEVWTTALSGQGIDDPILAAALAEAYRSAQRRGHPLIEGADQLVRSLVGRCRLGLLTNGPSDIQRLKLDGTGLSGCFDAVVVSGEVGVGKPNPAAFHEVLGRLGAEPNEAVMVGDSWERDIVGARQIGMETVWVAGGRALPASLPGVTVVDRVAELTGVVGQFPTAGSERRNR